MKKEAQFFENFTKNSRYIQIYNYINDAFLNGDYKIGDKLPSEKELCAMFNVIDGWRNANIKAWDSARW